MTIGCWSDISTTFLRRLWLGGSRFEEEEEEEDSSNPAAGGSSTPDEVIASGVVENALPSGESGFVSDTVSGTATSGGGFCCCWVAEEEDEAEVVDLPATPENSRTSLLINEPVVLPILGLGLGLLVVVATDEEEEDSTEVCLVGATAAPAPAAGDVTTPNLRWRFRRRVAFCVAFL